MGKLGLKMLFYSTLKLLSGTSLFSEERRKQLVDYFLTFQTPDGGFCGRRSTEIRNADPYYTSFALRGLFLLNALSEPVLASVNRWLGEMIKKAKQPAAADLSSFLLCKSLINSVRSGDFSEKEKQHFKEQLFHFRKSDACFGTSKDTPYSSTYQTFLTAISLGLLGETDAAERIPVEPILRRQREDGGFVELEPLRHSGTNPTAAAVVFLMSRNAAVPDSAAEFLLRRQLPQSGFQANTRVPVADLLSSFTAITALDTLGAAERCDWDSLLRFAEALRCSNGGYRGGEWDKQSDVEYTFYGMALDAFYRWKTDLRSDPL